MMVILRLVQVRLLVVVLRPICIGLRIRRVAVADGLIVTVNGLLIDDDQTCLILRYSVVVSVSILVFIRTVAKLAWLWESLLGRRVGVVNKDFRQVDDRLQLRIELIRARRIWVIQLAILLLQGELEVVVPYLSDVICSANLNALTLGDLTVEHALDWYLSNVDTFHNWALLLVARAGTLGSCIYWDLTLCYGLHLLLPDLELLSLCHLRLALELMFYGYLRFLGVFACFAFNVELEFELTLVCRCTHSRHAGPWDLPPDRPRYLPASLPWHDFALWLLLVHRLVHFRTTFWDEHAFRFQPQFLLMLRLRSVGCLISSIL